MTVTTQTNKITYVGNNSATTFAFNFPVLQAADLTVILSEGGSEIELAQNQYSVTGIGELNGGSVTYPLAGAPITSSQRLTILRRLAFLQETNFTNQSTIYADTLETTFDRIVMMAQQNAEKMARALVFSVTDEVGNTELPNATARAGKYLTFDASGNPAVTEVVTVGALAISSFWTTVVGLGNAALSRAALGVGATGTLGQAGAGTLLGNPTGATADPTYNSLATYLALLGNTRGMMLRRGASGWEALALGAEGTVLGSNGTDLTYVNPPLAEGLYRNLTIDANSNTNVVITADWLTIADASNNVKLLRNVNVTAATGTAGANGLDTGSVAQNTWYSVWVIYNPTSDTVAALLSTSASAPTLPSGFTYRHRFGWIKTQASSTNIYRTLQKGNKAQVLFNSSTFQTIGAGASVTLLGVHVPSTATEVGIYLRVGASSSGIFAPNGSYSGLESPMNFATVASQRVNSVNWFIIEGAATITLSGGLCFVLGWVDSI